MLILTRRKEEDILATISPQRLRELADAGEPLNIVVRLVGTTPGRARIGLTGPEAVRFVRAELLDFDDHENTKTRRGQ